MSMTGVEGVGKTEVGIAIHRYIAEHNHPVTKQTVFEQFKDGVVYISLHDAVSDAELSPLSSAPEDINQYIKRKILESETFSRESPSEDAEKQLF